MVKELPAWNRQFGSSYPTVMFSTGPMFLTMQYVRHPEAVKAVVVLPRHLYGGIPSFFAHYPGNSWHGADKYAVTWVQEHLGLLLGSCGLLLLGGLLLLLAMSAHHCGRTRAGVAGSCT
jgi:inositol phosphorylceramide mannosyltransferase catalytic subunit